MLHLQESLFCNFLDRHHHRHQQLHVANVGEVAARGQAARRGTRPASAVAIEVRSNPRVGAIGELLRSARLAQGLTVEQIATELRIETPRLLALEENNFEQIGIPVFVKGYLRQYGQRLGVASVLCRYRERQAADYRQTDVLNERERKSAGFGFQSQPCFQCRFKEFKRRQFPSPYAQ